MKLTIIDAKQILFEGTITSLSGENRLGRFSLLENHAHFIGLIRGVAKVEQAGQPSLTIDVGYGLVHCKDNVVRVFAHLPELAEAAAG